ncbi:AraC family transcriptional regulator [Saccharopolyspora rosea]|uniref:AraC family transcriptional regulator n=1 Tax=Saccharopolyspora rosea TaxID=524884 RepID=A0ABW3FUN7_9PSEU|nr:AraC family transcriptional regulator [Saccharopolyspora rosea]
MVTLPAGDFRAIDTSDWHEAHHAVADAYFPHELTALSGGRRPDLSMRTVDLGPVTIGRLRWGVDVAIDCDYPGAVEVNMPLSGRLESRHGRDAVVSVPGAGTIFPANTATPITRWSRDCTVVGVKFDRARLAREAERVLGGSPRALPPQLDGRSTAARGWLHFVRGLACELDGMRALMSAEPVREQLAGAITAGFLLATQPGRESAPPARPRIVHRVLDRVQADPARAWTAADMAEVAGVSVRRLQEGFQQYLGTSPSAALREIRLERVHADLVAADGRRTVTEIATRWGFAHMGRFAASYRRRYGLSPAESLRR